jgi:hypothetical protein
MRNKFLNPLAPFVTALMGHWGLNGAKNLATSTLSREEKINIITHGKNSMAAYGNELAPKKLKILQIISKLLKSNGNISYWVLCQALIRWN